ncbi:hypothetical protein [Gracilibacillus saliphilus]|uniref:hypothetical protein n=1 Tax=Gracilibacillus saliphilus TaxID=543890 RepID=UPI0013D39938|nr:hypothetical protein [Gracilibacillus saliphilus]
MKCYNCGTTVEEEISYCKECGATMEKETDEIIDSTLVATEESTQNNAFLDQVKIISSHYVQSLPNALKRPFETSTKANEKDKVNSYITFSLLAIFLSLYTYITSIKIGGGLFYEPSFFNDFIKPLLGILIILAALNGIIFAMTKIMKIDTSFYTVFSKLAILLIIPTGLTIIAVLCLTLSITFLSTMLFSLVMLLTFISSIIVFFTLFKENPIPNGSMDIYYIIFIANLVISIVLAIVSSSLIGNFIGNIGGGIFSY